MNHAAEFVDRLNAAAEAASAERTPPPVTRIVEALLFAGGQPITADLARGVVRGLSAEAFQAAVDELSRTYRRQRRPYAVQRRAEGYVVDLQPRYLPLRERLVGGPREARLSLPALDVLAVVAYRQPVTRGEIDSLRGHESGSLIRHLVRLGLIAAEGSGHYGTTPRFLDLFGLQSLDDLPRTTDLQKI